MVIDRAPLASEQVVLASPMSWTGATLRLWRGMRPRAAASAGWRKAGWWTLLWTVMVLAWLIVAAWYALLLAFGVIPLVILVIYRTTRRAQRRGQVRALRHAEIMSREARS